MQILPIASGKGGVGKSVLAANLSLALAQAGKKVVLADFDLGGSNIHLMLGIRGIKEGIGNLLNSPEIEFEDIIFQTEWENLRFIPGDAEIPGIANLKSSQKNMLIRKIKKIEADFVILDLGAGTSFNIVDFFLSSGQGLIITTPTPTATVNAYLFLKNTLFRIISSSFKKGRAACEYLEKLKQEGSSLQKIYIPRLLETIQTIDPESYVAYKRSLEKFQPKLILNMLEDPKDSDKALKLRRSCQQYLGIDIEHLGVVYRDDIQDIALGARLPVILYKPRSVLSQAIFRIADKIIQLETESTSPIDDGDKDESYQAAEMEAEIDYQTKIDYVEDLLNSGTLTMGELAETIKSQQWEINQLRKENSLLKSKIVKAIRQGFEA